MKLSFHKYNSNKRNKCQNQTREALKNKKKANETSPAKTNLRGTCLTSEWMAHGIQHFIILLTLFYYYQFLTFQVTTYSILTLHRTRHLGETQTKSEVLNRTGAGKIKTTETESSTNKSFAATSSMEVAQPGKNPPDKSYASNVAGVSVKHQGKDRELKEKAKSGDAYKRSKAWLPPRVGAATFLVGMCNKSS